jgi:hypothetical protein
VRGIKAIYLVTLKQQLSANENKHLPQIRPKAGILPFHYMGDISYFIIVYRSRSKIFIIFFDVFIFYFLFFYGLMLTAAGDRNFYGEAA